MGIDKSDVRYVLNHSLPSSIENYYQEAGRAGRDGKPSDSVLYFSQEDADLKRYLASTPPKLNGHRPTSAAAVSVAVANVGSMIEFCTSVKCRRVALLAHFGEKAVASDICGPHGCDVCAGPGGVKKRMQPTLKRGRAFGGGSAAANRFAGGGGFVAASSLRTPAAEFQRARLRERMSQPPDSIDYPTHNLESGSRKSQDDGVIDVDSFDIEPVRSTKSVAALMEEEEQAACLSRKASKTPRSRLLMRMNSNGVKTGSRGRKNGANVPSRCEEIYVFSDSGSESAKRKKIKRRV